MESYRRSSPSSRRLSSLPFPSQASMSFIVVVSFPLLTAQRLLIDTVLPFIPTIDALDLRSEVGVGFFDVIPEVLRSGVLKAVKPLQRIRETSS
jgi:hypothetical protein